MAMGHTNPSMKEKEKCGCKDERKTTHVIGTIGALFHIHIGSAKPNIEGSFSKVTTSTPHNFDIKDIARAYEILIS